MIYQKKIWLKTIYVIVGLSVMVVNYGLGLITFLINNPVVHFATIFVALVLIVTTTLGFLLILHAFYEKLEVTETGITEYSIFGKKSIQFDEIKLLYLGGIESGISGKENMVAITRGYNNWEEMLNTIAGKIPNLDNLELKGSKKLIEKVRRS